MFFDPKLTSVEIEDNKIIQKFYSKNTKYVAEIKQRIFDDILNMINFKEYKIKLVKNCKYLNHPVWEYKININDKLIFRIAYVILENKVVVFFMSTTLIKREFSSEVTSFLS